MFNTINYQIKSIKIQRNLFDQPVRVLKGAADCAGVDIYLAAPNRVQLNPSSLHRKLTTVTYER